MGGQMGTEPDCHDFIATIPSVSGNLIMVKNATSLYKLV